MNTFCPLIKDECKNSKCVLWEGEKCLIIPFLKYFDDSGRVSTHTDMQEETEIPEEIRISTPEKLAEDLIKFYKNQTKDGKAIIFDPLWYWEKIGIDKFNAPLEIKIKLSKVEQIFEQTIQEEREEAEKIALEKEGAELPKIADICHKWVKEKGIKKITNKDIELFLKSKNIKIMDENKRMLRLMVEEKMKP
ncbi:MAG: hypothetical protein ABSB11_10735 [Sedimentisphaerales bacterium]|jgi:hypothetical protein